MANTQDKHRSSAAQAPLKRGKNKPKEDGKQAPAPTNGKPLNKSAESSESTKKPHLAPLTAASVANGAAIVARGAATAARTRCYCRMSPAREVPAPKRSVHKKYVSIGGQASMCALARIQNPVPAENFASEPREPSEGGECTKEVHDPTEVRLPPASSITIIFPFKFPL